MSPDVFWIMAAWSVANAALWCHAMWLYDRAARNCRRVLDRLDAEEADPRPPSGAPLAAEIARHTETRIGRPGREERAICAECYEPWEPCLVRRLADRETALREIADLVLWGVDRDSATMHVALADLRKAMQGGKPA